MLGLAKSYKTGYLAQNTGARTRYVHPKNQELGRLLLTKLVFKQDAIPTHFYKSRVG